MRTVRPIALEFVSHLAAPADVVWSRVSTMEGVNAELRPWLTMTFPADLGSLDGLDATPGAEVFRSWLLVGGVVPIDRHRLMLERVLPGTGFDEESTSWVQRRWRHERRVVAAPAGGCVVTDRLSVEPRLGLFRPIVSRLVRRVFEHRHRRMADLYSTPSQVGP